MLNPTAERRAQDFIFQQSNGSLSSSGCWLQHGVTAHDRGRSFSPIKLLIPAISLPPKASHSLTPSIRQQTWPLRKIFEIFFHEFESYFSELMEFCFEFLAMLKRFCLRRWIRLLIILLSLMGPRGWRFFLFPFCFVRICLLVNKISSSPKIIENGRKLFFFGKLEW